MAEQFGVSRASVALVSTVGFLVFAAAQPLAGRLMETFPGRRLVVIGLGLCASGFAGRRWRNPWRQWCC